MERRSSGAVRGHGIAGTAGFFGSLGLQPGRAMAFTAAGAELCGGALFAWGLLTPLAAAMLIAVMVVANCDRPLATRRLGRRRRLRVQRGSDRDRFAVTAIGAADWSLDAAFGTAAAGATWRSRPWRRACSAR